MRTVPEVDPLEMRQLKVAEVAHMLGYSRALVYRLISTGELAAVRTPGTTRVTLKAIRAFQEAHEGIGPRSL